MANDPMGLLVAGFNYGTVAGDEFNDWYDTEHIPERERIKGFVNCERWLGADDPMLSIATYDLESLAVLQSPAYRAIAGANLSPWSKRVTGRCRRICRFEAEQILPGDRAAPRNAGALMLFAMNAAREIEPEFNAWYTRSTFRGCRRGGLPVRAAFQNDERRQQRQPALPGALPSCSAGCLLVRGMESGGGNAVDAEAPAPHERPDATGAPALPQESLTTQEENEPWQR